MPADTPSAPQKAPGHGIARGRRAGTQNHPAWEQDEASFGSLSDGRPSEHALDIATYAPYRFAIPQTGQTGEFPVDDEELFEPVALDDYLEMTARMLGRIHAIEATIVAALSLRPDIDALERHTDAIIVHDESSRIAANKTDEETIRTHEWARQAAHALFANARIARRVR